MGLYNVNNLLYLLLRLSMSFFCIVICFVSEHIVILSGSFCSLHGVGPVSSPVPSSWWSIVPHVSACVTCAVCWSPGCSGGASGSSSLSWRTPRGPAMSQCPRTERFRAPLLSPFSSYTKIGPKRRAWERTCSGGATKCPRTSSSFACALYSL